MDSNDIDKKNEYAKHLKRFNEFQDTSKFLEDIKEGDKIGRNGYRNFCIYQQEYLQGAKRWWYVENKGKTLEHLHEIFDHYLWHLEDILVIFNSNSCSDDFWR